MACELCEGIRSKLETELGRRLTRTMIDRILGVTLGQLPLKPCSLCENGYYALGLCRRHYAQARTKLANREGKERETKALTCNECSDPFYAKGKCRRHYMKVKYGSGSGRNDKGQRIGRKGQVLCDFEGCDYDMKRRVKAIDEKWYCSVHHKGEIMGDTGIEA